MVSPKGMAKTWSRKAYKVLVRAKAPRNVAKAGANAVGKAAYKTGRRARRTRRPARRSRRRRY